MSIKVNSSNLVNSASSNFKFSIYETITFNPLQSQSLICILFISIFLKIAFSNIDSINFNFLNLTSFIIMFFKLQFLNIICVNTHTSENILPSSDL